MDEDFGQLFRTWVRVTQGIDLDPDRVDSLVADFARVNRLVPVSASAVGFEDEPSRFSEILHSSAELDP